MSSWKETAQKYQYPIFVIYYTLYMLSFGLVEKLQPDSLYIIHCPIDQYIPFLEYFVVPYLGWFLYIGGIVFWLFLFDRENMCRLLWCGMIGMTIFVVISVFLPNGLDLRPEVFPRDNVFTRLTAFVYRIDTSTNVFPSIHVNNSICACTALVTSKKLRDNKGIQIFATVFAMLIILSTMFLKQHSVVDVTAGMLTGMVSCEVFFGDHLREFRDRINCFLFEIKKALY